MYNNIIEHAIGYTIIYRTTVYDRVCSFSCAAP